ncbi:uncharacterized protein C2845_PM04G33700 [Panicum miliaceum]|uniref:Uncharacterized protein n=1 Tax=Panicum miliaceum TaxID=4540 RepID=A0A3L6QX46_PANMI|nr:uncharacterized protein C2845_PM04G33700 [Panicum miliaceum]
MACGPAGVASALWPRLLLPGPAPCRSFPNKVQLNQVRCLNQLRWKLPLITVESHRPRNLIGCLHSDSSAEVAGVSRPADVSTTQSDQSMTCCTDSVPGALIVISGYWTGPDADDGCGSVEAMLQRIV